MLAMLYLVLFSALALGFYAATTTSSEVVSNDRMIAGAQSAAESGMEFMRYHLSLVAIPPGTTESNLQDELFKDLQKQMDTTPNLGPNEIGTSGNVIQIPASTTAYIPLDDNGDNSFRATITVWTGDIVVKVEGRTSGGMISRYVQMDYEPGTHTTTSFNFAIASRGQVVMKKGSLGGTAGVSNSVAQVMSASETTTAINMSGGAIGGDLAILDGAGVDVSGGSVSDTTSISDILANHVKVVNDPEFPTVDPTVYKKYATNNYVAGATTQSNIIIPPNTNPKFNANDTVQGVMYIQSPNTVTFNGNFKLNGFIVMESGAADAVNTLNFSGNLTQSPVPAGTQFDAVRAVSGVAILAPTAAISMSGSTDSYMRGSIITNTFSFTGSADIQIDQGTLMTLSPDAGSAVFNGKTVKFTANGSHNVPSAGLTYSGYYKPKLGSYVEVLP
jgi:hypothetical protein